MPGTTYNIHIPFEESDALRLLMKAKPADAMPRPRRRNESKKRTRAKRSSAIDLTRWLRKKRKPGFLERKFGMFGARGFVQAELMLLLGILSTEWLRWFFLGSAGLGIVIGLILRRVEAETFPDIRG